jgi:hypothetical protein
VFINYRGDDSLTTAGLIDRELAARFGRDQVFLDSESIPLGTDFAEVLLERLRTCKVLLVVMGPRWLSLINEAGERRIDDPTDWVRREIAESLARELRVIPVLLDGVKLPTEEELPGEIAGISRRQYVPLRRRHIGVDLADLVERLTTAEPELAKAAGRQQPSSEPVPRQLAGLLRVARFLRARLRRFFGLLWRPRVRWPVAAVVVVLVVLLGLIQFERTPGVGESPSPEQLGRIPALLRGDCRIASTATGFADAQAVLDCAAGGEAVRFSLYVDESTMDSAYVGAVTEAGVPSGSGDCAVASGGEHRYPGAGAATGRVVCTARDGRVSVVWTDRAARTIGRAVGTDDRVLASSWATWVGLPAFPTVAERELADLVQLRNCGRAPAGSLDGFRQLEAGIDCDAPSSGVGRVSYYRFADLDGLNDAHDTRMRKVNAPAGIDCSDGSAPGFTGDHRLDMRSVDVGSLLCYRDDHAAPVLEWSFDPLLVVGRASGSEPKELTTWWRGYFGHAPPTAKLAEAAARAARPPFPTAVEQALLDHIPDQARVNCMRPSHEQITSNVGQAAVTAAVVCGPTRGTSMVFYYQLADTAALRGAYARNSDMSGPDCTRLPADFHGDAPYARDDATGRLACGINSSGKFLAWSDDRRKILALAFGGDDDVVLIDWWRFEAGPV